MARLPITRPAPGIAPERVSVNSLVGALEGLGIFGETHGVEAVVDVDAGVGDAGREGEQRNAAVWPISVVRVAFNYQLCTGNWTDVVFFNVNRFANNGS